VVPALLLRIETLEKSIESGQGETKSLSEQAAQAKAKEMEAIRLR